MRNNPRKSNIKQEEAQNSHLRENTNIEQSYKNLIVNNKKFCLKCAINVNKIYNYEKIIKNGS